MDIIKKPYEISLWTDELVWVGTSGTKYYNIQEAKEEIVHQYYEETKLCVIGSDTMQSQSRAVNPKLNRKINGENTFTFTIYYQYIDNITGEKVENPYIPYLVSERKIKLKYNNEWFDFIIKNIQENSESKAFTYTCKDLFVTELSKTGFEIVLDNELENNMGTIEYLAGKIVEGSDWTVDQSDPIKQYIEEPLYKITLGTSIDAIDIEGEEKGFKIRSGQNIYVFYSNINDKKQKWQYLYCENDNFKTNDDLVIDKIHKNYIIDVSGFDGEQNWPSFIGINTITKERLVQLTRDFRGNRLVKQSKTKYDATIDKYVNVYDNGTVYGFTESEFFTSGDITNYIANPNSFTSTSGWQTDASQLDYQLDSIKTADGLFKSYIFFKNKPGALVMNSGISSNRSASESFAKGEQYVLRMKYKNSSSEYIKNCPQSVRICQYHFDDDSKYVMQSEIFGFDSAQLGNGLPKYTNELEEIIENGHETGKYKYVAKEDSDYVYMIGTCKQSISKNQLTDWDFKIGLFFDFGNNTNTYYLEDVQVFPYQTYTEEEVERLSVPGGKLHSEIKTKYVYYEPNSEWQGIEDLIPLDTSGYKEAAYEPYYESGSQFTKVRSISAKESNRFNLLQDLCETFQAWMKIKVERESNGSGKLKLDKDYRPIKKISFVEAYGDISQVGFRYGVNSKSIQRTVDSAAIVSKMIVKDNANEFAPNGFCSIARATENPTGENFLLNFDHYIRHGLLDFEVVTNDLYLENINGYLGYYAALKRLNSERNEKIDIQAGELRNIMNQESAYTTYKLSYDAAIEEQLVIEKDFCRLLGQNIDHDKFEEQAEKFKDREDLSKYWVKWGQRQNVIQQHGSLYKKAKSNWDLAQSKYDQIESELDELTKSKKDLWEVFYKKYSRFIQEGSWIKEDYTDPNLYYIDAESTLYASTQPKITYNISVIDISSLPEYQDYNFNLGDISYIEDVEFFFYSRKPGAAPYREEIIVSEINVELDSPEKTQIKVQNYKTQFEDLFQRITAQTQQAEYHTGEYNRVAGIVETNGTIAPLTLENSFANNAFKLSNARDQSVVWNEYGITTTSLTNPSEMVRIISGGVFLSNDGGQSWKTGVTGAGINTSYLTAGQINTNEIYIMNGNSPAFRWDSVGLSAYASSNNATYNTNKFVRFDQYGIYGIIKEENWVPTSIEDIHNNAHFALTWKGFSLKSNHGEGYIQIDSENDIVVSDGKYERLKIGCIGGFINEEGENKSVYGIKIKNSENNTVLETDDTGSLWLREKMSIESPSNKTIQIGNLDNNQVINANFAFIVYQDGRVFATNAEITGAINANSGKIGNLRINNGNLYTEENSPFGIYITENTGNAKEALIIDNNTVTLYGIIQAQNGGNIGGFKISDGQLVSQDEKSIILDGNAGTIFANSITLGSNITIADSIKLGEAYIRNPLNSQTPFIEAGALKLFDKGLIQIGDILLDGTDSENSKIWGNNFYITSDRAEFSNVSVSGEIETVIFKTNSVQAAGGAMIFRPSYKIKEVIDNTYILQEESLDMLEHNVWVVDYDGKQYAGVVTAQSDYIHLTIEFDEVFPVDPKTIIDLGYKKGYHLTLDKTPVENKIYYCNKNDTETIVYDKDSVPDLINETEPIGTLNNQQILESNLQQYELNNGVYGWNLSNKYEYFARQETIIGINSGNTKIGDNLIYPCGLTITELGAENPKLYMGDLSQLGRINNYSFENHGHGLYADNVYLNGSLTTYTKENGLYAGINTIGGAKANKSLTNSDARIIFWAGAKNNEDDAIREAPFQVTEDGYVYVENSIFAGGTITGAEIYTAKIYGNDEFGALSIYDASKGISFKSREDTEVFSIGNMGLTVGESLFIKIENDQAIFKTKDSTNYLSIQEIDNVPALYHHHSNDQQCGMYFEEGRTLFKFSNNQTITESLEITTNSVNIKQQFEISQDNLNVKMQYKAVEGGYDLYIVASS